jgi:hypothetical protein
MAFDDAELRVLPPLVGVASQATPSMATPMEGIWPELISHSSNLVDFEMEDRVRGYESPELGWSNSWTNGRPSIQNAVMVPGWWQVNLGGIADIRRVDIWHRADPNNIDDAGLEGATITASGTVDYHASDANVCGHVQDYTLVPEHIDCSREGTTGRYLTLHFVVGTDGLQDRPYIIQICELAVWGAWHEQAAPQFRGAGLQTAAYIGDNIEDLTDMQFGLRGAVAMLQIYNEALPADEIGCVYESGRELIQSGRTATSLQTVCRAPVTTGCTSRVATKHLPNLVAAHDMSVIDDGSCTFDIHKSDFEI